MSVLNHRAVKLGIVQLFNDDADLPTLCPGGIHFDRVDKPSYDEMPYVLFRITALRPDPALGDTQVEKALETLEIRFRFYAGERAPASVDQIAEALDRAYGQRSRPNKPVFTNGVYDYVNSRRITGPIAILDEGVWVYEVDYEMMMRAA